LAKIEENEMIANFGQDYENYMESAPRFLPKLLILFEKSFN
jgi:protein-S-isoprenylcysteine O-methyltransferase Ste14